MKDLFEDSESGPTHQLDPNRALRLGLLGGTFDPPHLGHLWLAETARAQLSLDWVLFLPAGEPPHKQEREVTAVSHRLAMLQLALDGSTNLALDTTDVDRPLPHTTVTLLPLLRDRYPQAACWLVIGSDSLWDLPNWVAPDKIIKQCRLAVLPRPGESGDWHSLESAVPGARAAVDWLDGPRVDLSATEIRQWANTGHSLRFLLPPAVIAYLRRHKLYQKENRDS